MDSAPQAAWLNLLIGLLYGAQQGLLQLLAWLGLVPTVHGQPAWPGALRLSGENLLIEAGQARRLALTLLCLALALLVVLLALAWRRRRWPLLVLAPLLVLLAPWPDASVVWVAATPASFHRSPTGFTATSITQGGQLYAQHCVACHGADGRGHGPLAATQPVWPPDLAGPLLWRRADGDLLWHILHGMADRNGRPSMPAFDGVLGEVEVWALIDFMKAQGAGQALRVAGVWPQPIALPGMAVLCAGRPERPLAAWRGQRLRLVLAGAAVLEDPRVVTVQVLPGEGGQRIGAPAGDRQADCVVRSPDVWNALALIAATGPATADFSGTQLLVDRDGWLRARSPRGQAGWSEDDLLCSTGSPAPATATGKPAAPADGLGSLIVRMDAEPVRYVKGGFVH